MIGTKGTLKHQRTQIHNVPLLFCPVCHRVRVHHLVEDEYEILAEYAHGDDAADVDFLEYVDESDNRQIYENCVNHEKEEPADIIQNQIDMALDLLMFAKQLQDKQWQAVLKKRLGVLSERRRKLKTRKQLG